MRRSVLVFSILLLTLPFIPAPVASGQAVPQAVGVLHLDGQQIEVLSWSWGATQTVSRAGGGAGAGKVQLQDFHFTKTIDRSSASLFEACAKGQHFPSATLTLRKAGKGQQDYLVVKMSDVFVSSYQSGGSGGDALPSETIALNYGDIELLVPGR